MRITPVLLVGVLLANLAGVAAPRPAEFVEHLIDSGLTGGYQVVAADMNKDGKPDLIVLASGMKDLVWYENPGWRRHVIAGDLNRMINLGAWDTSGDGVPEIVLAHEFANQAKNSLGILSVLTAPAKPGEQWKTTEIDRIPTSHRLRWADIFGNGKKVLVNAPLAGVKAEAPDYRDHTPLIYYTPGTWIRQLISAENEGVVHGIHIVDWDGDGRDEILTAGFGGIHRFALGKDGRWTRTEVGKGDPSAWPKSGSSDVTMGRAGKVRYIAAIEPWHGNQVAIYREEKGQWPRLVIDDSLASGHTILAADFNGDSVDEVVAGFRGNGGGVVVYYAANAKGTKWTKQGLDGSMAASSCAAVDLNGDGRVDLACIGSATANLKWYENRP